MTAKRDQMDAQIALFHAESRAHGEANVTRLSRMLGLIAIGFGGLAAVTSLLWERNSGEVLVVAPFIILILWMSCVRLLAEMAMSSVYQRYYDHHLAHLVDTSEHRFRSWQDSAPNRGGHSAANLTIYGFVGVVSVAAVGWCAYEAITTGGWVGYVLAGIWGVAVVLIIISAARLPALQRRVASDLAD